MSTDPTACEQAHAFFQMEALELLQTIEQDLLSLKEDHSLNKVHNLMRVTHTLKGAAASIGLETLKQVAHSLEDVFQALYNPTVAIDSELEELLFQAYECLRLPISAELTNTCLNESNLLNRAAAVFTQLQVKLGDNYCWEAQFPTAAELGVDITKSIFETDVTQRLAALADALELADANQVAIILRSQATVFMGLAESLDLPGFGAIAQTAIATLDAHPDHAVTIAQIALTDFQQAQALVLAGDRTHTGEPSPALQLLVGNLAALNASEQNLSLEQIFGKDTGTSIQESGELPINLSPPALESSPAETVRVDLERLEHLNYLTGDLLTNQTQQGVANEQLKGTVEKLQQQVRRHQQTLRRIHHLSHRLLVQPVRSNRSSGQNFDIDSNRELDALLHSAWEETIRLAEATGKAALLNQEYSQTWEKQQQLLTDVRDDLTGARISPLGDVFNRLRRVLQQLVAVYGKPVELHLSGTEVLVDKAIAQKLYDLLLHLVRNAFDHGIESPQARCQLGKPETGQIRIHAYQHQRATIIEVSDDGKGLDFEKIIARAIEMNLLTLEQAFSLSQEKILALLFAPGFSTAAQLNELSGRGFGLDVVRSQLQVLQGSITVRSEPHRGTTFALQIPPTPTTIALDFPQPSAIISAQQVHQTDVETLQNSTSLQTDPFFVWLTGSYLFILPYTNIEEYLVPQAEQIVQIQKQRFLHWQKQMIPLYELSALLNYNYPLPNANFGQSEDEVLTLVINQSQRIFAIESAINRLVTEPELAIKPFGEAIAPPSYIYGSTVLEDKRLVLVIDSAVLLRNFIETLRS